MSRDFSSHGSLVTTAQVFSRVSWGGAVRSEGREERSDEQKMRR